MRSLTLRGGRLALPTGEGDAVRLVEGDLQIVDGVITALGRIDRDVGECVEVGGLVVAPGFIDPQVHFREPGATHKEDLSTGARACAAGGITAFLEMPNTRPTTTTHEALAWKKARAAEVSLVHYGFFIGATPDNLEVQRDAEQVCAIKVFMGSSTGDLLVSDPADLERIFASGRRTIAVHAEDEARLRERSQRFAGRTDPAVHSELRDAEAALLASRLALELSERFDRRLHILHMSTGDEVELLRAQGKGAGRVSCEVTPQHLLLHAPEAYEALGTRAQMNPPLRDRGHAERLWAGLHDGTIDCIATDHAPHTLEEKAQPYGRAPSGMPGVETSAAAMLDAAQRGLCTVEQVIAWMSPGPARCYRMIGKGALRVGGDGDVTLIDLGADRRVGDRPYQTRCGWSPFEGRRLRGWPVGTIVAGRFACREGELIESTRGRPLSFGAP
jgi:dihydroorotase